MKKIRRNDEVIKINCGDKKCENCIYEKYPKCTLFDVLIDNFVYGHVEISGIMRHIKCIEAEI